MNLSQLKLLGLKELQSEAINRAPTSGLQVGRVASATRDYCSLLTGPDTRVKARIPGRLHHLKRRQGGLLPVVGDWVLFRPSRGSHSAVIEQVLPRHSCISRQAPGRRGKLIEQVIASNVDLAFIVCGLDRDFNLRRIERYLALVSGGGAEGIVLLNKADLCRNPAERLAAVRQLGCRALLLSARSGEGIEDLLPCLQPGITIALLGSSGVGKSTLINKLLGEERQAVSEVSESDGKGRHTTTHRELMLLPGGGLLMDNPGMRELQLWGDSTSLEETFGDVAEIAVDCRFNDCRHLEEPGCAVKQAVEEGRLPLDRLQSFRKLQQELKQREENW